jgi:hypothetical protein
LSIMCWSTCGNAKWSTKWDKQLEAMQIICQQDDWCVISNFCESMASQNNVLQRSSISCCVVLP